MSNILQVLGIGVAIAVGVWSVQEKAQEKPTETPVAATTAAPAATPAAASSAPAPVKRKSREIVAGSTGRREEGFWI